MKGRNYFGRDDYVKYQLPKGAIKVCDKASDAVAYLYAQHRPNVANIGGSPCAVVFYGNQAKPVARFRYRSEAERERSIRQYFDARQEHNKATQSRAAERKTATATAKFQVGKTYHDRSSCDWDTVYSFKVIGRTAKQLTIEEHGKVYKRGIYVYDGVESCKPHGTYSMCSVIRADRETV